MILRYFLIVLSAVSLSRESQASVPVLDLLEADSTILKRLLSDTASASPCFSIQSKYYGTFVSTEQPRSKLDSAITSYYLGRYDQAQIYLEACLSDTISIEQRTIVHVASTLLYFTRSVGFLKSLDSSADLSLLTLYAKNGLAHTDSVLDVCGQDPAIWGFRYFFFSCLDDTVNYLISADRVCSFIPSNSPLISAFADFYYRADLDQKADSLYTLADKSGLLNSDELERWATAKNWLEQYEECIRLCDRVLSNDWTRSSIKALKGRALYKLERYEEVIPLLTEVVRVDSTDEWSWFRLGYSQRMLKQTDEMIHSMRTVLRLGYEWPDCYYNLACGAEAYGDFETAVLLADSAVMLDSTNADYYWLLAHEQNRAGKLEASVHTYTIAKNLAPRNAKLWWESSQPLWKLNRLEEMWAAIDSTLKYDPNHEGALHYLGNDLFKSGNHKRALSCFEKLTKIRPKFVEYWEKQSILQYLTGQYEESLRSCDEALLISPNSSSLQEQKKEILVKLGRKQ